ncbi:uncharacterized protein LOC21398208 [Morus notabilis]|uniref:uncharacterized protein LOC21398208 n=1 Tax=Morus notabilis TaxID=981085 RepID=UPI000CED1C43|nr:uncharacterized protein LOC21398208 [Morus notabilis]
MLDQASSGPNNFVSGADISTHVQVPNMPIQPEMGPYVSASSLPYSFEGLSSSIISNNKRGSNGNFANYNQYEAGDSSLSCPKVKMAWQGDNNLPPSPGLQLGSWFSRGQNYYNNPSTTAQSSRPVPIRNKCYDPLYEEMGLPIDPHLRMFLARRDNGEFGDRFS